MRAAYGGRYIRALFTAVILCKVSTRARAYALCGTVGTHVLYMPACVTVGEQVACMVYARCTVLIRQVLPHCCLCSFWADAGRTRARADRCPF